MFNFIITYIKKDEVKIISDNDLDKFLNQFKESEMIYNIRYVRIYDKRYGKDQFTDVRSVFNHCNSLVPTTTEEKPKKKQKIEYQQLSLF